MPNRIIKESIKTSRDIDRLSWFEEVFFYRLIVSCDDYGRYDGDPLVLRNTLFPTKDNIPVKDIEAALVTLGESGLVSRYTVADGKMVLQILGWARHQNVRAKKSKYPPPPDVDNPGENVWNPFANNCMQMNTDASICSRNPIQSNTYAYSEYENVNESVCDARAREPDPLRDVDNTAPITIRMGRRAVTV